MLTEVQKWQAIEAENYLKDVRGALVRIKTLADAIANIYTEIDGIKAIDYSRIQVSCGEGSNALTQLIADKEERIRSCQQQAHDLECMVRRCTYVLSRMEDQTYAAMLEAHYLNGLTWGQTAEEVGYSGQHLYRLRYEAFYGFYVVMMKAEKDTEIPDARWPVKRDLREALRKMRVNESSICDMFVNGDFAEKI